MPSALSFKHLNSLAKMYSTPYGTINNKTIVWTDQVVSESLLILHILQAVFTDPKFGLFSIVLREWRKVPCINLKVPNLDLVHIFYFCDLKKNESDTLIKMRKQMDKLFKAILMENTIKVDYLSLCKDKIM